jgi:hypothetical protein
MVDLHPHRHRNGFNGGCGARARRRGFAVSVRHDGHIRIAPQRSQIETLCKMAAAGAGGFVVFKAAAFCMLGREAYIARLDRLGEATLAGWLLQLEPLMLVVGAAIYRVLAI